MRIVGGRADGIHCRGGRGCAERCLTGNRSGSGRGECGIRTGEVVGDGCDGARRIPLPEHPQLWCGNRAAIAQRLNQAAQGCEICWRVPFEVPQLVEAFRLVAQGGGGVFAELDDAGGPVPALRFTVGYGVVESLLQAERLGQTRARRRQRLRVVGGDAAAELGDGEPELLFARRHRVVEAHEQDVGPPRNVLSGRGRRPTRVSAGQQPETDCDQHDEDHQHRYADGPGCSNKLSSVTHGPSLPAKSVRNSSQLPPEKGDRRLRLPCVACQ